MLRKCRMTLFKPTGTWDDTAARHNGPPEEVATVTGYMEHGPMSQQQTDIGIGDNGNWMWFGRLPRSVEDELRNAGNTPARGWKAEVPFGTRTVKLDVVSAYQGMGEWQLRMQRVN